MYKPPMSRYMPRKSAMILGGFKAKDGRAYIKNGVIMARGSYTDLTMKAIS